MKRFIHLKDISKDVHDQFLFPIAIPLLVNGGKVTTNIVNLFFNKTNAAVFTFTFSRVKNNSLMYLTGLLLSSSHIRIKSGAISFMFSF